MDIGRALTYFSEDERWIEKTAVGTGLLLISSLLLVALIGVLGYFILFGYLVRLLQNVRDDVHPVLPEWDRWGDDLVRGAKLACVYLVWTLPVILVSALLFLTGTVISENAQNVNANIGAAFGVCAFCLQFLIGIAYLLLQPGVAIAYARNEMISDGLQASEIWDWTRDNIGNVAIVAILTVIAGMIITTVGSIVGLILCVVGAVVTVPLSQLVIFCFQSHLYGQLARLAGESAGGGDSAATPAAVVPPAVFNPQAEQKPPAHPESSVAEEAPELSERPEGEELPAEADVSTASERHADTEPPEEDGPRSQPRSR